jgi:transposase-like protein
LATKRKKRKLPLRQVLAALKRLSGEEPLIVYETLQKRFYHTPDPIFLRLEELRATRLPARLACPFCGEQRIRLHGQYRRKGHPPCRRFRCLNPHTFCDLESHPMRSVCGKTFTDITRSPLNGTHYLNKWDNFLPLMAQGYLSLRETGERLGVSKSTVWYWQQRILDGMKERPPERLQGEVEADETFLHHSLKGQRGKPALGVTFEDLFGRHPRKGGRAASKRGISIEQVCVFTVLDQQGHVIARYADKGSISKEEVSAFLSPSAALIDTLRTDAARCYHVFALQHRLAHVILTGGRRSSGVHTIQHINAFHSHLKIWMGLFRGLSTRWLGNYLV